MHSLLLKVTRLHGLSTQIGFMFDFPEALYQRSRGFRFNNSLNLLESTNGFFSAKRLTASLISRFSYQIQRNVMNPAINNNESLVGAVDNKNTLRS